MAVLSSRAQERRSHEKFAREPRENAPLQSPRAFSALARLYYLVRPTKAAMLRRLYRKRLLGRILQFKRDHNYKFIWTVNGKIILKKTESSATKFFVTHEEFKEFLDKLN